MNKKEFRAELIKKNDKIAYSPQGNDEELFDNYLYTKAMMEEFEKSSNKDFGDYSKIDFEINEDGGNLKVINESGEINAMVHRKLSDAHQWESGTHYYEEILPHLRMLRDLFGNAKVTVKRTEYQLQKGKTRVELFFNVDYGAVK